MFMKKDLKNNGNFMIILKGFIIGSSMSVPGVSGGTMAILLGIYDKLIAAISNFTKDLKKNILFLFKFCIGGGMGIFTLAFVIKWLLDTFPFYVSFFFLGAVVGGIPALYQKTKEKPLKISSAISFLLGLGSVIAISFIPAGNIDLSLGSGLSYYFMIFLVGIVIAIALVLPGISTSHMLLVLGMYDSMLLAITEFDIGYIVILGISTIIGIFLITKPIEWTLNSYPHNTYWMIIGFVIGSTQEIFTDKVVPGIPDTADLSWWIPSVIFAIAIFVLGFQAIKALSKFSDD